MNSYLSWVQDSEFEWPGKCRLCTQELVSSHHDTVRLTCLHLFHSRCLSAYGESLPGNTAPAGFGCPSCGKSIAPASGAQGRLVDTLRMVVGGMPWGPRVLESGGAGAGHDQSRTEFQQQQQQQQQYHHQRDTPRVDTSVVIDVKGGPASPVLAEGLTTRANPPKKLGGARQASRHVDDDEEDKYKEKRGGLVGLVRSTPKSVFIVLLSVVVLFAILLFVYNKASSDDVPLS